MDDEAADRAHPGDGGDAEDARAPGSDFQEVLEPVAGSGSRGGHAETPHGRDGRDDRDDDEPQARPHHGALNLDAVAGSPLNG